MFSNSKRPEGMTVNRNPDADGPMQQAVYDSITPDIARLFSWETYTAFSDWVKKYQVDTPGIITKAEYQTLLNNEFFCLSQLGFELQGIAAFELLKGLASLLGKEKAVAIYWYVAKPFFDKVRNTFDKANSAIRTNFTEQQTTYAAPDLKDRLLQPMIAEKRISEDKGLLDIWKVVGQSFLLDEPLEQLINDTGATTQDRDAAFLEFLYKLTENEQPRSKPITTTQFVDALIEQRRLAASKKPDPQRIGLVDYFCQPKKFNQSKIDQQITGGIPRSEVFLCNPAPSSNPKSFSFALAPHRLGLRTPEESDLPQYQHRKEHEYSFTFRSMIAHEFVSAMQRACEEAKLHTAEEEAGKFKRVKSIEESLLQHNKARLSKKPEPGGLLEKLVKKTLKE